jgi:hypothetical protein
MVCKKNEDISSLGLEKEPRETKYAILKIAIRRKCEMYEL